MSDFAATTLGASMAVYGVSFLAFVLVVARSFFRMHQTIRDHLLRRIEDCEQLQHREITVMAQSFARMYETIADLAGRIEILEKLQDRDIEVDAQVRALLAAGAPLREDTDDVDP